MKTTLIILSGGMDSVTLLHERRDDIALAITFSYGQKHIKEIQYTVEQCKKLYIAHMVIDISSIILPYFKSNLLLGGGEIPLGTYEEETMHGTVVPFRNGIFLSIAVGIAESKGLDGVMLAAHAGDHALYPDCRKEFISSMAGAIFKGTYNQIFLFAPYVEKTKRQIALIGKNLGVDYAQTWSCYEGRENHCGKCGTCIERKEALKGFDPTTYEA